MAHVRRLDASIHIELVHIRGIFDIEDFSGKLNGFRGLRKAVDPEHRR
jgi:hypothetical protein